MIMNTPNGEIIQMGIMRAKYLLSEPEQTTYEDIHLLYVCQHVAIHEDRPIETRYFEKLNEEVTKEWIKRNESRL